MPQARLQHPAEGVGTHPKASFLGYSDACMRPLLPSIRRSLANGTDLVMLVGRELAHLKKVPDPSVTSLLFDICVNSKGLNTPKQLQFENYVLQYK